jgi:hypothetical protein
VQLTKSFKEHLNLIEDFSRNLEDTLTKISISKNKSYSDIAAENFLRLLGNHIEGVWHLAHQGLYLLPSALVISRSVIEVFGKLIWLIEPDDPDQRVLRLIAMLEDEKNENNLYKNKDKSRFEHDKNLFDIHISNAKNNLSDSGKLKKYKDGNPECKKLLKKIGEERLIPLYNQLHKSVHGNHSATWIYHNSDDVREIINEVEWYFPLFICRYTLIVASEFFLKRFGGDIDELITKEIRQEIKEYREEMDKP